MTIDEMLEKVCNGENSPVYELCDLFEKNDYMQATKVIKNYLECDDNTAKIICMDFKTKVYDDIFSSNLSPQEQAYNNAVAQEWLNKPKCPTCGSQNIEKISLTKKAFGGAMFGLFSSDIRNTMHCKNCGYKW